MRDRSLSSSLPDLPPTASRLVLTESAKPARAIRVFLADEQTLFRSSLRTVLHKHAGFKVVGEAGRGDDLLKLTAQLHPDVLLLDIVSAGMDGMKVLTALQNAGIEVHVLVLAAEVSQPKMLAAMRCGAKGFVLKTSPASVLLKAIRQVAGGQYWIEQENLAEIIQVAIEHSRDRASGRNQYGLTPRQDDIIVAVLDGYSNPEIAEKLGLSEQTVKHHLSHIFDKLGVYSRLELALFAVAHKLVASRSPSGAARETNGPGSR